METINAIKKNDENKKEVSFNIHENNEALGEKPNIF